MTDINQLAIDAGAARFYPETQAVKDYAYLVGQGFLERYAELAIQAEREACAKYIESCSLPDSYSEPCLAEFAKEIRAGEHR